MSNAITLPVMLRSQLVAAARRVRLLQTVRGVGLLVFVLTFTAGLALLLDWLTPLPGLARLLAFGVWGTLGLVTLTFGLILPLLRRVEPTALAAVIEKHYPELGERLTSAVELDGQTSGMHGSPQLIQLLMNDAVGRAGHLDIRPALPARRATWTALAACASLLLLVLPAVAWPNTFGDLAQRFFLPWTSTKENLGFTLEVTPGNVHAALGRPLTITAQINRETSSVRAPAGATLVVTDAEGAISRKRMIVIDDRTFRLEIPIAADFRYRVEAGAAESDTYQVIAVAAPGLATDSPRITIEKPIYARTQGEVAEVRSGILDMQALQHSTLTFHLQFEPVVKTKATLEWLPTNSKLGAKGTKPELQRNDLVLADDGKSARFQMSAIEDGSWKLLLEGEHGITTTIDGAQISVIRDMPPEFARDENRLMDKGDITVTPTERIPLRFKARDDIAVQKATLIYQIVRNSQQLTPEPVEQAIDLKGAGTPEAISETLFGLSGKAIEGDQVLYRVRVQDNRPEEFGGPQVVTYPEGGRWMKLNVKQQAAPLAQQDIIAQGKDIADRLESIREELRQELRGVYNVKSEAQGKPQLTSEQGEKLRGLQKQNRAIEKALRDIHKDYESTPALQPIGEKARDLADREMRAAEQELKNSGRTPQASAARDTHFLKAEQNLEEALRKLDALKRENDKATQQRLDQAKVEALAERQKDLADKANDLANNANKDDLEKLKKEQADAAAALQKLTEQDSIKKAIEEARAEEARQLADKAKELAQDQRDLAKAMADAEKARQIEKLAELAKKQEKLAQETAKLAQETKQPTKTARTEPLKSEQAEKAAKSLKEGDANEAIKQQEQAENELKRVADAFDRALNLARDPREAAAQLAQLQGDLKNRLQNEMDKQNADRPLANRLQELQRDQHAIQQAADRLSIPPEAKQAQSLKDEAGKHIREAVAALAKPEAAPNDVYKAKAEMESARKDLENLAKQLPSLEQRTQKAINEVAQLKDKQDQIRNDVEKAIEEGKREPAKSAKELARKLADASRRQAENAERLSKLDAPRQEERQERAVTAQNRALADLLDGRKQDAVATQLDARRQLERLEQSLRGQATADEKAAELARKQRELADEAAKNTDGKKTQELQAKQQEIANKTRDLPSDQAPQRKYEAVDATKKATDMAQAKANPEEMRKQMQEAARKLDDYAKQLKGDETDLAKTERLAKRQAEAATQAARDAQEKKPRAADADKRLEHIARETKQIKAGEDASGEKQKALDALEKSRGAKPEERVAAERQAADALKDLADKLAGRDAVAKANDLARQQRELADQAAKRDADKQTPAEAKKAAEKQAELARQMQRLDQKQDAASKATQKAAEQMNEARKALDNAKVPAEAKDQIAKAADAAEQAARDIAKEQAAKNVKTQPKETAASKPTDSPKEAAKQLAQAQRDLLKAAQDAEKQAASKPGEAGKEALKQSAQNLERQQKDLNERASQLPANQSQKGLEQARQAMNQAREQLAKGDQAGVKDAQQKQREAAEALDKLAKSLPEKARQAARQDGGEKANTPVGMPSKEQTDQARNLAKQQRELRDEVRRSMYDATAAQQPKPGENPLGDTAKQQAEIAKAAAELAKNVAKEQGADAKPTQQAGQARQATQQASRQAQAGATQAAQQSGKQAAEQLRQLAQNLGQTPNKNESPNKADTAEQARQLAKRQDDVNRQLEKMAANDQASRAQQTARQQNLQQQAKDLAEQFQRNAQQSGSNPATQQSSQQAANASRDAQNAMQDARNQSQQGNQSQAGKAQESAARALDRAAQQAAQAAQGQPGQPGQPTNQAAQQAGQSLQQAQNQMSQAQSQLGQGKPQNAQSSMNQAAQNLAQAAQQLAQAQQSQGRQPGQPGKATQSGEGAKDTGPVDLAKLSGEDLKKYAARHWGELPGELKTKLIQEMQTRFGEDYAPMIKLYFEQIADTKKKK